MLIEQALNEDKHKLANRVLYFSNKDHCQRICCLTSRIEKEVDTKLIALVEYSDVEHGHHQATLT